jgi:hypothetical protein
MGLGFSIRDDSLDNINHEIQPPDNYVSFQSGQNFSKSNIKDLETVQVFVRLRPPF